MSQLEILDRDSWESFAAAPKSFLMVGKSDCAACNAWTTELTAFLETDAEFGDVRFAKVLLDTPGLGKWKKANPWIADLSDLPANVIIHDGERVKEWLGGGVDRMANRLRRVFGG